MCTAGSPSTEPRAVVVDGPNASPEARESPSQLGSGVVEAAQRARSWAVRTNPGHSSAPASNKLYGTNPAKGQTGLSVAFDLPTQTGDRHGRTRRDDAPRSG